MSTMVTDAPERNPQNRDARTIPGGPARRRAWRRAILTVALLLAPRAAAACSLVPVFTIPVSHPSTIAFLGSATGDTLRAGSGVVRTGTGAGHFGRSRTSGAIHGQVVRVERLVPGLPTGIADAVRDAGGRVVLVPWDYAADCQPLRWTRSARWLPDTARGLFQGTLREREHWVGDVPTLDVFAPQFLPYTGTSRDGTVRGRTPAEGADSTRPPLSPDELLALQAMLPTPDAAEANPDSAFATLLGWAAAHPTLAVREPARSLIRRAEWMVADFRFRQRRVPLAGTYRVTIRLADATAGASTRASTGDSVTFYARTEASPSSPVDDHREPVGMYVRACAAATEAALPAVLPPGGCSRSSPGTAGGLTDGYLAFGDSAWAGGTGRTMRAGSLDVAHGDSTFRARVQRLRHEWIQEIPDQDPSHFLPGRFTETSDGSVSFAWTYEQAGVPRMWIEAVRVSPTVLRQP